MTVLPACSLPQHSSILAASSSNPGIKLFGKNIPAPAVTNSVPPPAEIQDEFHGEGDESGFSPRGVHDQLAVSWGSGDVSEEEDSAGLSLNENKEQSEVLGRRQTLSESRTTLSTSMEAKAKALQGLSTPVPCPRCESLDTKFCYFNNYNVKQPRHFCKHCQRYWTAGGTLRNVPVGAGKRKCKYPSSQQRPAFALQSVVYRRDDPGAAKSLLSYSTQQQTMDMNSSLKSAPQTTNSAANDSKFLSPSMSFHMPSQPVRESSSGSPILTGFLSASKDLSRDFESHARDSHAGQLSNTTERPELSLCSTSAQPPSNVSNSTFDRSTLHQDQTSRENISNTQILPVLAVPWPVLYPMYRTQIPILTPTSTFPLSPSPGGALSYEWSQFPGSVWTFPSTAAAATAHSLGIPASLGKRPAKDIVEGASKTSKINAHESAASSSSYRALDTPEKSSQS